MRCSSLIVAVFFPLLFAASAIAADVSADWPQWRGPSGNGVAEASGLPLRWSRDENVAWRTPLPGPAGSTPVVVAGRIFLTTSDGGELKLMVFDAVDGSPVWQRVVSTGNQEVKRGEGNYASPSPVSDGKRVVALMGDGRLTSYSLDGDEQWSVDLQGRYGQFQLQFGYTSTPALHSGRLYVQMIHGDGDPETHEARVVALDAATGDEVWSTDRVTGAERECEHAYTSPVLITAGGVAELLTHGADYLVAYDPADGRERWRLGGMNAPGNYHPTLRFVASPGVGDDLVIVPTAKRGPLFAVRPGGSGDVTGTDRVLWSLPRATPDVPTPLVHEGLVYLCSERGALTCVDVASGEVCYQERAESDRHRSSPVYADGRVYLTSRGGVVTVVRAGRQFEILAQNNLGEEMSATPVIVGDTIYLRTFDAIYAIRQQ